jgi:hypothetical protein
MSRPRYAPLIVSSLLLAGCTATGAPEPVPSLPAASPAAVTAPPGSRLVTCEPGEAHEMTTRTPHPRDVTAGALSWPGLAAWATADPAGYGPGNGDYKLGAVIRAGAVVTVTVPESHRDVAGLRYGQAAGYRPAPSVTFQGCAYADTAYIGGFRIEGRRCVPFDVTGPGQPPVRVTVSFFAGPCPT